MRFPSVLFAGAGDIAKRTAGLLPTWHSIALSRSLKTGFHVFNDHLKIDLTEPFYLEGFHPEFVVYTATPAKRDAESYSVVYQTGLLHLLQSLDLNKIKRFVFISSTAVYGSAPYIQNELSEPCPPNFNGQAILRAEKWLQKMLGSKLCILRFSGLYGPDKTYLQRALLAKRVRINPAADNFANRLHIDDAARSCAHVLCLPDAASDYIATDSTPLSQSELYHFVAKKIHAAPPMLDTSISYQSKHFSNQRLLDSGFQLLYPSTKDGYAHFL